MKEHFQKLDSYKQKTVFLILAFAIIRAILAFTMALGVDESYYWTYSQDLKWNYFDHPPLVALVIRLTTINLLFDSVEGFIRLGSIIGCALSSWFIYKTCEILHSQRAGFYSACLYNVSFYAAVTGGLFIMPDSAQMVFFTLSLWLIARIATVEKHWLNWILFGIAAGLCIMSKIHGVFIWIGLGLYIVFFKRSWLKLPQVYIALLISLLICSPILIWNIQNDFATYQFHGDRIEIEDDPLNMISFSGEVASQFLYNNPFTVLLIIIAIYSYARKKDLRMQALGIYNLIASPLALLLLAIALFRNTTLPHWSGPAYIALIPAAAIHLASSGNKPLRILFKGSIICFLFILLLGKAAIHFYYGELGETAPSEATAGNDVKKNKLLQVFDGFARMQLVAEPLEGWSEARKQFDSIYQHDLKNGITKASSPLVCNKWHAAQIEYYFCNESNRPMIGLGKMNNLHEYLWKNAVRQKDVDLNTAYFISPEIVDADSIFTPYYNQVDSVTTIISPRKSRPSLSFYIYRLTGWRNNLPVIY